MNSTLEDFYYSNLRPNERINSVADNSEVLELNRNISTRIDYLKTSLSEENFTMLEDLIDLLDQSTSIQSKDAFINGFKIATLIMTEVFTDNPQPNNRNQTSI